jgi:hypothetical protein
MSVIVVSRQKQCRNRKEEKIFRQISVNKSKRLIENLSSLPVGKHAAYSMNCRGKEMSGGRRCKK